MSDPFWLKELERRTRWSLSERIVSVVLLVLSVYNLLHSYVEGSVFFLAFGVVSLVLWAHSLLFVASRRGEAAEELVQVRAEYEGLEPWERKYLDRRMNAIHHEVFPKRRWFSLGRSSVQRRKGNG